jgi:membrane protease YdiL (CAAX protease family)
MRQELNFALLRVVPFVVILLVIAFRIRQKRTNPQDLYLHLPPSAGKAVAWWGAYLLFILATEAVLYRFGLLEITKWNHPLISSIIRISGAVVFAPIAEELLFRGVVLHKLTGWKINRHLAIVIQAVLFALAHSFTYRTDPTSIIGIAQVLVDGVLYGYAMYQTDSIYTPIAMHMTGNLIATLERFIF